MSINVTVNCSTGEHWPDAFNAGTMEMRVSRDGGNTFGDFRENRWASRANIGRASSIGAVVLSIRTISSCSSGSRIQGCRAFPYIRINDPLGGRSR